MARSWPVALLLLACLTAACTSVPSNPPIALSANVDSVRVTRDAGLIIMPSLDKTITDRKTARRLAADLLALPVMPSGNYSCPMDYGTTYTLDFTAAKSWSSTIETEGCRLVDYSDGSKRWALTMPAIYSDLPSALGLRSSDFAPLPCAMPNEVRCYPERPSGQGLVTGGIKPCQAIVNPNAPRYAAGTVTVLKGRITYPAGSGPLVFPTSIVATQTVGVNETYLLALDPGDYVLRARFPAPANAMPFAQVTVKAGIATPVDIPNMCI